MDTVDIVLINIISYFMGIFTGVGFFLKYKDSILIKSISKENLNKYINDNPIHESLTTANEPVQPVIASAPPLREITIKTNDL